MFKLLFRNALALSALAVPATVLAQPVVNAVINNFSGITPGLPSYGIAPASLFVIYGSAMCDNNPLVTQDSSKGLPTTLNNMTISVTVNGVTTTPAIYYAIPTQIAAVLPSTTPAGTGTITVKYKGQSGSAPLLVTKSAFGMLTLDETGSGGVKASDLNYKTITPTASAAPGQIIVLWGSGLGADKANDDRTYPLKQDNLNNATVYIGGVKAKVLYAGRSQFPGVDQIDVTVPEIGAALASSAIPGHDVGHAASGFQGGCGNAVAVVANNVVSNFGTLPVNVGNGVCSDPGLGTSGGSGSGGSGTRKGGYVEISKGTIPSSDLSALKPEAQSLTTIYSATGGFTKATGSSTVGSTLSLGNCLVYYPGPLTGNETVTGLDAGSSIGLAGGGLTAKLAETPGVTGSYYAKLTSALQGGSAYTFTGTGGKDVGSFTVTITFPTPLVWGNIDSITDVTESQGQLVTWTGGATGTYVIIGGTSSTNPPLPELPVNMTFACWVPVSDLQFTIPSYVLLSMPTGKGTLGMTNSATPVAFTATGLDNGVAMAGDTIDINVTYK
jgi:uncharacterized protein (TIGR03437 family)